MSQCVRVQARDAAFLQQLQHVAFSSGDTTCQCNSQHTAPPYPPVLPSAAVSVFLSSIAIVSGPTPPGTGESAPATSATFGCTSPTTSEPRFSKVSHRF